MRPARRTLLGGILICSFHSPVVSAAPPPKRPIAPEARADYDLARAAFKRGEYRVCIEALERAQKASPDPRLFWNSAACEKKLGHYAKAIGYVERYLAAGAGSLTDEEKKEAASFLDAARAYVARVNVSANVEGVRVFVDDDLVGTTPLARPLVVDEGEHVVRYVRLGYVTAETNEKVVGGSDLTWAIELSPEHLATAPPPSPSAAPSPPQARPRQAAQAIPVPASPSRVGPLVLGGAGVVAAGVGAFLLLSSLSEASTIEEECGTACPRSRWEPWRDRQIAGDITLVAGGAMIGGAVLWWLLQPSGVSVSPRGVAFEGHFE